MTPTVAQPAPPADWRDLVALTKPRVMSLVVFTGLCGLLVAPETLPLALAFTAILCIALGAGAAGALNQWYETDLDAKMRRTAMRLQEVFGREPTDEELGEELGISASRVACFSAIRPERSSAKRESSWSACAPRSDRK